MELSVRIASGKTEQRAKKYLTQECIYWATRCTDISSTCTYFHVEWDILLTSDKDFVYLNTALYTNRSLIILSWAINHQFSALCVKLVTSAFVNLEKPIKIKKGDLSIKFVFVLVDSSKEIGKNKNIIIKTLPHKSRIKFVVHGNQIPNSLPSYFKTTLWLKASVKTPNNMPNVIRETSFIYVYHEAW